MRRLKMEESDGSPYLFVDQDRLRSIDAKMKAGTLRVRYEMVRNFSPVFNRTQKDAALKPLGCFHDLRKTFGTRVASAGVPMHELCRHMGHSSIVTTALYYTDVEASAADRLRKAVV